ncbi:2-amino-4-hydroxy-6-hydroxymethyldihydropteridine diphosphokinase [Granulicella pectinivorans]|jgi:2-amino-4-hydroxy-6-hydroxymethyldihydropteridine diphosphokinase|nr:2-amino-4-hydroxy-6-hydroxymethyldihydropteridine diphosphokinase [Granulicella pectinivorans]
MVTVAAVALGSNLGDRVGNLLEAIRQVRGLGTVTAVSSFYDTEPVGYVDQPRFVNAALLLETTLTAQDLMTALLAIETAMGRVRVVDKGPRLIDLDLLLFGDAVIRSDALTLPHPGLRERQFVLEPLAEIAPGMVDPRSGLTVSRMLALVTG